MKSIQEEYASHEVPEEIKENITHPYYLIINIEDAIKEYEKEEKKILRRRRKNRIAQNVFISNQEILKEEVSYYTEMLQMIDDIINMLVEIADSVTEDNLEDAVKMVDFLIEKYGEHMAYFEGKMEALNQAMKGIGYIDNRHSNQHEAVKQFIEGKINHMKTQKQLEKSKEM